MLSFIIAATKTQMQEKAEQMQWWALVRAVKSQVARFVGVCCLGFFCDWAPLEEPVRIGFNTISTMDRKSQVMRQQRWHDIYGNRRAKMNTQHKAHTQIWLGKTHWILSF